MAEPSKPKYPSYGDSSHKKVGHKLPNLEMPRPLTPVKDKHGIIAKMKAHQDRMKLVNKLESFFSSVDAFRNLKG